ncbi:uncharacterized protein V2V93DRAFT_366144 [Kockiozyma suomiensis]|uniref:uncharacterized protein n=1 Tax=Kockiozyma suomiensis TaxID=1337062 RepID=UPI003342FC41
MESTDSEISISLVYLQTAAHSLARTSPAISSHIYARFVESAAVNNIILPVQLERSACSACNAVWIPGYNLLIMLLHNRKTSEKKVFKKRLDRRQRLERLKHANEHMSLREPLSNKTESESSLSKLGKNEQLLCYVCLSCEKVTRFVIPDLHASAAPVSTEISTPVSTPGKQLSNNLRDSIQTPQNTPNSEKSSTGSSSKKRQKARKQNSLQMILAKAKAEREGKKEGGMSLLDMMKTASKR